MILLIQKYVIVYIHMLLIIYIHFLVLKLKIEVFYESKEFV